MQQISRVWFTTTVVYEINTVCYKTMATKAVEKLAGRTILKHHKCFTTAWFCMLQQELVRHSRDQQYSSQLVAAR